MKSRIFIQLSFMLLALPVFILAGCKKDNLNQGSNDATSLLQLTTDEMAVDNALDQAAKNAEGILSSTYIPYPTFDSTARDSIVTMNDTITFYINYDGYKINRTGKIEIKKAVSTDWTHAGATVIFKFIGYTISKTGGGIQIEINGTMMFQNVNGMAIRQLGYMFPSVVHRLSGSIQTTFDNGTSHKWNIARQITYSGIPDYAMLKTTIDGFANAGGFTNLVTWGTNRNDEDFFTQITQPVVHFLSCYGDPVSGIEIHQVPAKNKSVAITFGYDSNNEPISGGECPTKYRLDWQRNGKGTIYSPLR